VSIITDETPIEQMRNRLMKDKLNNTHPTHITHTRKPKIALLREVFGRGEFNFFHLGGIPESKVNLLSHIP